MRSVSTIYARTPAWNTLCKRNKCKRRAVCRHTLALQHFIYLLLWLYGWIKRAFPGVKDFDENGCWREVCGRLRVSEWRVKWNFWVKVPKDASLGSCSEFYHANVKRHLRKCPSPSTYRIDSVYRDGKVHNRACSSLLLRSSCIYLSIIDYTHRECLVWWKYSFAVKKFTYNSPSLLSKIIYFGDKTWKTIIN